MIDPIMHVVVVDDHPLFREGVASILRSEPDIEVIAQGGSAQEAIDIALNQLPDVILLDITMPGGGLRAAQEIATSCPVTKIVMLTASEEEEDVTAALKAGARAYIVKGVPARELVRILRSVMEGEVYVTPALATSLLLGMAVANGAGQQLINPLDVLTQRERDILELLATGASNKDIGQRLHLTEKTVKAYMTNILQKLQVSNRVEAALLAQRNQLGR